MDLSLHVLLGDFADALLAVDQSRIRHKSFQAGIGPFGEAEAVRSALAEMQRKHGPRYGASVTKRQPDLLIPNLWQVELKVVRPFGDNGKEAENWSQNLLHPYPGSTSSLGDCMKLLLSQRTERRAVIAFGYEHLEPLIRLEPCVGGFELLAKWMGIRLSSRLEQRRQPLVHPVHQVLLVFGWEVLGRLP